MDTHHIYGIRFLITGMNWGYTSSVASGGKRKNGDEKKGQKGRKKGKERKGRE